MVNLSLRDIMERLTIHTNFIGTNHLAADLAVKCCSSKWDESNGESKVKPCVFPGVIHIPSLVMRFLCFFLFSSNTLCEFFIAEAQLWNYKNFFEE